MRHVFVLLLFVAIAAIACAQDTPKVEVFGGYQFISADNKEAVPELGIGGRQSMHGFNADVAYRAMKHVSLVADFGAAYKSVPISTGGMNLDMRMRFYPILFGPRVSVTKGKVTPFAEALVGIGHISVGASVQGVSASQGYNKFAMAFGGGLDMKVANRMAVRVVKFDYLLVHFSDTTGGVSVSENLNNLRLATGVVFTF